MAPGQTGNDKGRPKAIIVMQRGVKKEWRQNIATLVAIRDNKHARSEVRAAAAKELLDRAFGKPSAAPNEAVNTGGTTLIEVSTGIYRPSGEIIGGAAAERATVTITYRPGQTEPIEQPQDSNDPAE